MAVSRALVCLSLCMCAHSLRGMEFKDADAPIEFSYATAEIDYRNQVGIYTKGEWRQGDLIVQANTWRSSGDLQNGRMQLEGGVLVRMPDGRLRADTAIIVLRDGEIISAEVNGTPAQFEHQQREPQQQASGTARRIQLDAVRELVRLSENAVLSYGAYKFTSGTILYRLRDGVAIANPEGRDPKGGTLTIPARTLRRDDANKPPSAKEPR